MKDRAKRRDAPGPRSWPAKAARLAINVFLIFHLVSVACWAIPVNNPLVNSYRNFIRPYFSWTGLFQSWDMFAPSPKTVNAYVEAIVLYSDGDTRRWAFPRMELLSLKEKYFKERYRKFVENVNQDENSALWPDVARFIARLNNDRRGNPVKMVFLVRYFSPITPGPDGAYLPAAWDTHIFFSYPVRPEDLK